MRALRYENESLSVADVSVPDAAGEALVRVTLSGICNTDLEIVRGYAGFRGTLGHEFVGVVERAPDAPALVGKRVVGEINAGCGVCELCAAEDARHCPQRTVLGIVNRDGAHAEFLQLPSINLLPVPDAVPDARAVFTEPLAAACGIIERASITSETRVVVIGDGKLGLLCAQAVKALTGAPVTLVGKHSQKMSVAAQRGVDTLSLDRVRDKSGRLRADAPRAFDLVIEASGAGGGFALALDLVRPRGVIVLKSTFHGVTEMNAARLVVDEVSVIGSRCGRFAPALDLLERNAVDVDSLISDEYPLVDGLRAMERAAAPGVLKVLLRP